MPDPEAPDTDTWENEGGAGPRTQGARGAHAMLSSGDNPVAGQLAATTVAAPLGSQKCVAVLVQNDPGNTVNVAIGDSNNQYFSLKPGQA